MNVVLIGFMGTGKSAIGRALAQRLGAIFWDSDTEIEREAGKPIRRIFAEDGEAAFRAMETAWLERLSQVQVSPRSGVTETPLVLATGGGTPLREENASLLRRVGRTVWLTASADAILQRVGPDLGRRPLLAAYQDNPRARVENLLAERRPHYAAAADLTWDTSPYASPEAAAASLVQELCQRLP